MRITIGYDTKYGNGRQASEYLAQVMKTRGHHVECHSVRDTGAKEFPPADLYIFSSPTHIGRPTWKMKRFLKKVRGPSDSKYALMTTCMDPDNKTLDKMGDILRKKGWQRAHDGLVLKVEGGKGPLEKDWKIKLKAFAALVLK